MGEVETKIGIEEGSYSMGVTFDEKSRIIAIVRGQPLLKVFEVRKYGSKNFRTV